MIVPENVSLASVFSFIGAILAVILFAFFYLRRYRNQYENDIHSFTLSVVALIIVLVTSSLLPIDIFLVSFMKHSDGSFKDWAQDQSVRDNIENIVLISYYVLYGFCFLCLFILIPFMYFFYEEKEESFEVRSRFCDALKFTFIFLFIAIILFIVGALAPLKPLPKNSTATDDIIFIFDGLKENKGEDAISMVLNILCVLGMVNVVFYTGFGMSSWPIGLIRGIKSSREQSDSLRRRRIILQTRIEALREKAARGSRITNREQNLLEKLEEEERNINIEGQYVENYLNSWSYKLRNIVRPCEILLGIFSALVGVILWVSLLLTNIDKQRFSRMDIGYALPCSARKLPSPIDIILLVLQKIFPLDYVMILCIQFLLILFTFSGIRNLGIRLFFFKMGSLRRKRTSPQGLLLTVGSLMLTVLAFNVFFFSVSQEYSTYGYQNYQENQNGTLVSKSCSEIEKESDQCVQTVSSTILLRFLYKAWFFGVIYYWATWAFLLISVLALLYSTLRKGRSRTDGLINEDDFEEEVIIR